MNWVISGAGCAQCGIGWHGDTERRIVVGLRLGAAMDLRYQWFREGAPVGTTTVVQLQSGDLYVMSDLAVGWNWRTRKGLTLRHCAGAARFTQLPKPSKAKGTKRKRD
jgi:hypothetical protein